jgi:SCP1.201-like deaminase
MTTPPAEGEAQTQKAARLKGLFKEIDLPEITGIDLSKMSHAEMAKLLPAYGGPHPIKAILIDKKTGKAYGIASGWEAETITENGRHYKAGAISPEVAVHAGKPWTELGNHVEPVAAAFMRKMGIKEGVVYINGRNPCWGTPDGTGCYYQMSIFLEEGSVMTVYNKWGQDHSTARPERKFNFLGVAD